MAGDGLSVHHRHRPPRRTTQPEHRLRPVDRPGRCAVHPLLRHTCATLLLAAGVSPRVVMDILGHSQIAVTMNIYGHVMPAMQQEAAGHMDAALTEPEAGDGADE
ncbi:tyrosine-type recombinase/integrase [Micromonospora sp. DPT]|uniref:tyrosine-type recombinase/integrase n=1 Tax=Micromonospora sp. DPT TaxID=3142975 RepID=UPI0032080864